ncbi:hypothetical protein Taro_021236 [Colocasia esculenta]|uniref:Uncharacterized protein n=1 Tax=Colocasia esculenta TaxID=4460 RepID=A0A843UQV0_COLES|nr:hypothetical protein [Colocasia esculenta]
MVSSSPSSPPLHGLSVGESLRIYGDGDKKWLPAEITAVGDDHRCEVLYGDGEREWLSLAERKYIVNKDWKGSLRRRRKVGNEDDGEKAEQQIDTVKNLSLDTGEQIPLFPDYLLLQMADVLKKVCRKLQRQLAVSGNGKLNRV